MVVNRLLGEQIIANWEHIKYAAVSANGVDSGVQEYCNGLLINLLCNKYQCWLGLSDDSSSIIGVAITKMYEDVGSRFYLLIDTVYVYQLTTDFDKQKFLEVVKKFGEQLDCAGVIFYTDNPKLIKSANQLGFNEIHRVFKATLGGK